jgi:predicted transcriptional regulator
MKPNEIRAALLIKDVRPAGIANKLGVSRAAVSVVISGKQKSARIQKEIAGIIGKKIEEIWPGLAA